MQKSEFIHEPGIIMLLLFKSGWLKTLLITRFHTEVD